MLEKRSFYEESAKVPLLIHVPGLSQGQTVIEGNWSHIDAVPTVLDLLGEPVPTHLHGRSRRGVLEGTEALPEDVFMEWNGVHPERLDRAMGTPEVDRMNHSTWRSVVSGRWKVNLCASDQCELFDLANDPHEMVNLFDDPAQRDRIRDLSARIRLWQRHTADTARLPDV